MDAPGCFLANQQQRQLVHRTAKDLLWLRLEDANPQLREEKEIRRLEKEFQNEDITILVRHPTHDLVAEVKIPIIHSTDCIVFFKVNHHPLTVHRAR